MLLLLLRGVWCTLLRTGGALEGTTTRLLTPVFKGGGARKEGGEEVRGGGRTGQAPAGS